jgi:hypothetical protein
VLVWFILFVQDNAVKIGVGFPPPDCWGGTLRGVYYDQLPHWVVDHGCYSLMLRCRGSLPGAVLHRLSEIGDHLKCIEARNEAALQQQRRSFKILEAYLDQSHGFAPFLEIEVRRDFNQYLQDYSVSGLSFTHWAIMPNHIHLLTSPLSCESVEGFKAALKQFKLRSTRELNRRLGRVGSFWQSHWYDRWVRNETEYGR